jgi:hypothetical protein
MAAAGLATAVLMGAGLVAAVPAQAASTATIDLSQVPTVIVIPETSCADTAFPVTVNGATSFSVDAELSQPDYPISFYNGDYTTPEAPGVPLVLSGQLCAYEYAGPQTMTVTLTDSTSYPSTDLVFTVPVTVKALPSFGVPSYATYTDKVTGSVNFNAVGQKVTVMVKNKGAKSYHKLGKAKVKKNGSSSGKYTLKVKKDLAVGTKVYVKLGSSAKMIGGKTKSYKVKPIGGN